MTEIFTKKKKTSISFYMEQEPNAITGQGLVILKKAGIQINEDFRCGCFIFTSQTR
jgi:pyrimidine deaminase RibD-like protein